MKTLAPFVVACLILLALAVRMFLPTVRDTTDAVSSTAAAEPTPATVSETPHVTDSARMGDDSPSAARRDETVTERKREMPVAAAPAPESTGVQDQPVSETVAESVTRWAPDDLAHREKQRFAALRDNLASDPYNEVALKAALDLARQLEWHSEASDLLDRLVQLRPNDSVLRFEHAVLLLQLERWFDAAAQLRRLTEHEPDNAPAWYNLAIAHQAIGHLSDARAAWSRVIELMPENPDVYAHRGEVLLDLRLWEAATDDFRRAIALDSEPSPDAAMNLSLALWRLGRLHDARGCLSLVLEHHPRHVPLLNRLAEITWALHQADPSHNNTFADETAHYCRRSLAVAENQSEVRALLTEAEQAGD